jgi:hypothetical protein
LVQQDSFGVFLAYHLLLKAGGRQLQSPHVHELN